MKSNGTYSEELKKKVLARLVGPYALSASALSREVGISQSTLSRWLKDAGTVGAVSGDEKDDEKVPPERSRRRLQDWTPEEKLRVVVESMKISDADLGEFLRREGLHEVQLREWRDAVFSAGRDALDGRSAGERRKKETKRVRELEKELRRKEKALAEAAALIVLEKKLQTLWGAEDVDTDEENEK
jgi:transposase